MIYSFQILKKHELSLKTFPPFHPLSYTHNTWVCREILWWCKRAGSEGGGGERSFGSPSYTGSNEGISIEAWRCCCCALKTKGVETCVCVMGETFTWKMRMMNKIILHTRFSCITRALLSFHKNANFNSAIVLCTGKASEIRQLK